MKHIVRSAASGALAASLASAAQALPTDNSESGMPERSVVGSDYWAEVYGPCYDTLFGSSTRCRPGRAHAGRH